MAVEGLVVVSVVIPEVVLYVISVVPVIKNCSSGSATKEKSSVVEDDKDEEARVLISCICCAGGFLPVWNSA